MPKQGYLLIADIDGYTAFFTRGELEHALISCKLFFQRLQPFLERFPKPCRSQIERTPPGDTKMPCFFSSLDARS